MVCFVVMGAVGMYRDMGDKSRESIVARHRGLYETWRRACARRDWAAEGPAYVALRAYELEYGLPGASVRCWDHAYLGQLAKWPEGFDYVYPGSDCF